VLGFEVAKLYVSPVSSHGLMQDQSRLWALVLQLAAGIWQALKSHQARARNQIHVGLKIHVAVEPPRAAGSLAAGRAASAPRVNATYSVFRNAGDVSTHVSVILTMSQLPR
jgi:hypothetical protein